MAINSIKVNDYKALGIVNEESLANCVGINDLEYQKTYNDQILNISSNRPVIVQIEGFNIKVFKISSAKEIFIEKRIGGIDNYIAGVFCTNADDIVNSVVGIIYDNINIPFVLDIPIGSIYIALNNHKSYIPNIVNAKSYNCLEEDVFNIKESISNLYGVGDTIVVSATIPSKKIIIYQNNLTHTTDNQYSLRCFNVYDLKQIYIDKYNPSESVVGLFCSDISSVQRIIETLTGDIVYQPSSASKIPYWLNVPKTAKYFVANVVPDYEPNNLYIKQSFEFDTSLVNLELVQTIGNAKYLTLQSNNIVIATNSDSRYVIRIFKIDNQETVYIDRTNSSISICGIFCTDISSEANIVSSIVGNYISQPSSIPVEIDVPSGAKYIAVNAVPVYEPNNLFVKYYKNDTGKISNLKEINLITEQIIEKVDAINEELSDNIPYNDMILVPNQSTNFFIQSDIDKSEREIQIYNPYKETYENQYMGQMHCHSFGTLNEDPSGVSHTKQWVENVFNEYKELGYDFMTMTNYMYYNDITPNPYPNDTDLIWLFNSHESGTANGYDGMPAYHVLNWNAKKIINPTENMGVSEYISYITKNGVIAELAHPFWRVNDNINTLFTKEQLLRLEKNFRYVEVYNGECILTDYWGEPYRTYGPDYALEVLASAGHFVFGTAVSDSHQFGTEQIPSLAHERESGNIKVFANTKTREDIIQSILTGNYYSCEWITARLNSITLLNNVLTIDIGDNNATTVFKGKDGIILSTVHGNIASYSINGDECFVRAIVTLSSGYRIWTNPIYLRNVFNISLKKEQL